MKKLEQYFVRSLRKSFFVDKDGNLRRKRFMSSNAPSGQVVQGSPHSKGYRVMGFRNKSYFVHRVKFAVQHGFLPICIDHINGIRDDNRLENLRASSPQENQQNRRLSKKNKSGFRGVYFQDGKWVVQLRIKWKRHCLGRFNSKRDAANAVSTFLLQRS